MSLRIIFHALLIFICMAACDPSLVYERNIRTGNEIWERENKAVFEVFIRDTARLHNILVNVRNTADYPKSNLYLFITVTGPSGNSLRDTLQMRLADETGRWLGRGAGNIWAHRKIYKNRIRFPREGKYVFEIEQAMRLRKLPGITDVGIRIEEVR